MDYVCGEATLQFAYTFIPTLPTLDYRFFYTSNISLKRQFLCSAMATAFDSIPVSPSRPSRTRSWRFGSRRAGWRFITPRRARLPRPLDGSRRLRATGVPGGRDGGGLLSQASPDRRSAPRAVDSESVSTQVENLAANPALCEQLAALDRDTDGFLRSFAKALEQMLTLRTSLGEKEASVTRQADATRTALESVLSVVFEVERTRGKIDEWYRG